MVYFKESVVSSQRLFAKAIHLVPKNNATYKRSSQKWPEVTVFDQLCQYYCSCQSTSCGDT